MNTNKNSYTIIYATILVVVVAALLAIVSLGLKDRQQENIQVEKQMNILGSANLGKDVKNVSDKNSYIKEEFSKYVKEAFVINANGEVIAKDSTDIVKSKAFGIEPSAQFDIMRKIEQGNTSYRDKLELPIFICYTPEGEKLIILSCYGSGLWGPIWGFISLKDDFQTISGALFDHASETPGLGGEIVTDKFRSQFIGKIVMQDNNIVPIKIVKGGIKDAKHEVDALSGATITSVAVQTMIENWLKVYEPFLEKQK